MERITDMQVVDGIDGSFKKRPIERQQRNSIIDTWCLTAYLSGINPACLFETGAEAPELDESTLSTSSKCDCHACNFAASTPVIDC